MTIKSPVSKRGITSLSYLFLVLSLGFSALAWPPVGLSASVAHPGAAKVRLSFFLGGSPLPPLTVGLKVGDQLGTPNTNRDLEMMLDAPGNYPISLTGGGQCRIDRIHAENTGDKIEITGSTEPTLQLHLGARDFYRVFFEISCGGTTTDDGSLIQPTKPVFAVNESITIEYNATAKSGWDSVAIVLPTMPPHEFSTVTPKHIQKVDNNDNSLKDRRGTLTFDALPEGEYDARYVAWYHEGKAGAQAVLKAARFTVGKPGAAPVAPSSTGGGTNPPVTASPSNDLTGLWRNPGGKAIYRVRQIGTKVVWLVDAVSIGSWANVFRGQLTGNTINGLVDDLPGSPTMGGGRMQLRVESDCRITKVSSVNQYGANAWVRIGSPCDTGQ